MDQQEIQPKNRFMRNCRRQRAFGSAASSSSSAWIDFQLLQQGRRSERMDLEEDFCLGRNRQTDRQTDRQVDLPARFRSSDPAKTFAVAVDDVAGDVGS